MIKEFYYKEKKIGTYNPETNVFFKLVNRKYHYMKKYKAWGIDFSVLEQLPKNCIVRIVNSPKIYTADVQKFYDSGIKDDFGFGIQIFLPLKEFKET